MVFALGVVALVGCSGDDATDPGPGGDGMSPGVIGDERSAPYVTGWVPDGFHVSARGWGTGWVSWGSDDERGDSPITLVSRTDGGEPIIVSAEGYEGMQGLWGQITGYWPEALPEVVVDRGESSAVLVIGAGATPDELQAIADGTTLDPRRGPPQVDAPDGFEVAGQASLEIAEILNGGVHDPSQLLGEHHARSVTLRGPDGAAIAVATLPGTAGDPEAAARSGYGEGRERTRRALEVEGRAAWLLDDRMVVTTAPWGDLVFVGSSAAWVPDPSSPAGGSVEPHVAPDVLVRVAGAVEQVGEDTWEALVAKGRGREPWTIAGADVPAGAASSTDSVSSPFVVRSVPQGYRLAGTGGAVTPLDPGTTTLRRRTAPNDVITVQAQRFGREGVDVDLANYYGDPATVQGREARVAGVPEDRLRESVNQYTEVGQVLIAVDDLLVVVSGFVPTAELEEVAAAVDLDDLAASEPPTVAATEHFEPVGQVAAPAAAALPGSSSVVDADADGPEHHRVTFQTSSQDTIEVWTFPAGDVDVPAVDGIFQPPILRTEVAEVEGRTEWSTVRGDLLVTESAWGDVIAVISSRTLGQEALREIARSVEPIDDPGWTAYGREAIPGG
jgi:hypothetical protein